MREKRAMGIILPSGDCSLMGALMDDRTIGSVPFGGRYRLIDFVLSNMLHAGIGDIGVITRDKYRSLMDHLGNGRDWDLARKNGGLALLPPLLTQGFTYTGEISSLWEHRSFVLASHAQYVVLASADLVGEVDVEAMLDSHLRSGVDITVACQAVSTQDELGENAVLLTLGENGQVLDVTINEQRSGPGSRYLGYLVMEKELLLSHISALCARSRFSVARDLLQGNVRNLSIKAWQVPGYCRHIHSLQSYYNASMALLDAQTRRKVFPAERPVLTRVRDEAPVKYGLNAIVKNSLIADGCTVDGELENCILFRGVSVARGAKLKNCIIMQNSVVDSNAQLTCVVADRRCYIKPDRLLAGYDSYPVVIGKDSVI